MPTIIFYLLLVTTIIFLLLKLFLSNFFLTGSYDARMRVVIKHLAWRFRVSWDVLEDIEREMSKSLVVAQYEMTE